MKPNLFEKILGSSINKKRSILIPEYYFEKISEIQCLQIGKHLDKLDNLIKSRRNMAKSLLKATKKVIKSENNYDIDSDHYRYFTFWQFLLNVRDTNIARKILFKNGIETGTTNLPNLSIFHDQELINAMKIKTNFIFIPLHEHIKEKEFSRILNILINNDQLILNESYYQNLLMIME